MKASIKNIEQTIASEQYRPALSEEYQELFQRLTRRLEDTLPMNRARIISDELRRVSETAREADLDCQKYMAALSVLVDLSLQGWIFDFQDHQLTLRMENDNIDDKEKIRYRLSAERNAQFKSESVARFIVHIQGKQRAAQHHAVFAATFPEMPSDKTAHILDAVLLTLFQLAVFFDRFGGADGAAAAGTEIRPGDVLVLPLFIHAAVANCDLHLRTSSQLSVK